MNHYTYSEYLRHNQHTLRDEFLCDYAPEFDDYLIEKQITDKFMRVMAKEFSAYCKKDYAWRVYLIQNALEEGNDEFGEYYNSFLEDYNNNKQPKIHAKKRRRYGEFRADIE